MADDPWTCSVCHTQHAVPSLARRCEASHDTLSNITGRPVPARDTEDTTTRKVTGL